MAKKKSSKPMKPPEPKEGDIIGEITITPREPKFEWEVIPPGDPDQTLMVSTRYRLSVLDDAGYATFANLVNMRRLVSQDGEKPKCLAVVHPEPTGEFVFAINFDIFRELSKPAQREFLKEQMLRIPYGHFSSRAQNLINRYGKTIVERAGQIVLSQVVDPAVLAEDGIIMPVPEMWDFERNLTLDQYCELLMEKGGGAGAMPPPMKIIIRKANGDKAEAFAKCGNPELQEQLQQLLDENGLTTMDSLDNVKSGNGSAMDTASKDFMGQADSALRAHGKDLKSQGFYGGDMEEFIEALDRPPKLTWQAYLHAVHGRQESQTRIISPNREARRYFEVQYPNGSTANLYKGRRRDRTIVALWMIDTSGSMGAKELRCVDAELKEMHARGCSIYTMQIDAAVCGEPELYDGFASLEQFFGRGGTDFRPGFEAAMEMDPRPDYIVYFTDGYGTAPTEESEIPTLWVLTSSGCSVQEFQERVCSWGTAVQIDIDDD